MSSISANPLLKPAFWGKDNKNNRKGFCNLVAKAPNRPLNVFFVYAKTNRPNSSKLAMKKAVKHFLLNCLIFNVDQLGLEPRTSRL